MLLRLHPIGHVTLVAITGTMILVPIFLSQSHCSSFEYWIPVDFIYRFIYRCTIFKWIADLIITLRPRQDGRHFADDTFKCIFFNENLRISMKISLKLVPKGPIDNIPSLVQIMAWRRPGDKPLSEPMMIRLPTHICVTLPQWVKWQGTRIN